MQIPPLTVRLTADYHDPFARSRAYSTESYPKRSGRMLNNWVPVLVFFILVSGFGVVSLIMSYTFGVKKPDPRKLSPYECGVHPIGTARERFSVKFYLVAMLFLLFDIEAVFLFPWAVVYRDLKLFGFFEMLVFIAAILAGYVYAWKKGALDWER